MIILSFNISFADNAVQKIYVRGHGPIRVALLGADDTSAHILRQFAEQSCAGKGVLAQLDGTARHRIQVSFYLAILK
jgi:hypothetical protein